MIVPSAGLSLIFCCGLGLVAPVFIFINTLDWYSVAESVERRNHKPHLGPAVFTNRSTVITDESKQQSLSSENSSALLGPSPTLIFAGILTCESMHLAVNACLQQVGNVAAGEY
jgi:hypothetical protein